MTTVPIVIQYGAITVLYPNENNLGNLRIYIYQDIEGLPLEYDLMYIDEASGDWMILHQQTDLDKIIALQRKTSYALVKVLPTNEEEEMPVAKVQKVNKISLSHKQT